MKIGSDSLISNISTSVDLLKEDTKNSITNESFKREFEKFLVQDDKDQLLDACKEVENYFLTDAFKKMRDTSLCSDEDRLIPKGDYEEMFEDHLLMSRVSDISKSKGIGLAKNLYEQLKKY